MLWFSIAQTLMALQALCDLSQTYLLNLNILAPSLKRIIIHSMEKEMATYSSILAWGIPWMEEPGGLQSMDSPRVRHDWATVTHTHSQHPQNCCWAPSMPSAFSLLCLYSSAFPFLWNVLSSLAISTHSSLKTQLKCQLIPQPDVIFVWVPTTQCTLSWHLTFYAVLCIWRGSSSQMSYRWSSHSSPLRECQSHPSHGHLLFHCMIAAWPVPWLSPCLLQSAFYAAASVSF